VKVVDVVVIVVDEVVVVVLELLVLKKALRRRSVLEAVPSLVVAVKWRSITPLVFHPFVGTLSP